MRLRSGYLIVPFEKILAELESGTLHNLVKDLVELLEEGINLYVVLEPIIARVYLSNEKKEGYTIALSIGSLIIPSTEANDYNIVENIGDKLWILAEDIWAKTSLLSRKTKIYVHGFNCTKIIEAFGDVVSRVNSTTITVPFVSLVQYPSPSIEIRDTLRSNIEIKLLRPGHVVVNGLKEILLNSSREIIEIYNLDINEIARKPVDVIALINSRPFILESLETKSVFVLGRKLGEYSKILEDLLAYNSIIYMLAS